MITKEEIIKEIIKFKNEKSEDTFDKISLRVYVLYSFFGMSLKEICSQTCMTKCRAYYGRGHKLFGY